MKTAEIIKTKTPLKLSFAGGLSDIKPYSRKYSGFSIASAIDKYIYVSCSHSKDGFFNLNYMGKNEICKSIDKIDNEFIREAIRFTGLENTPLNINIRSDLSPMNGLGSSAALTVGLLNCLHSIKAENISRKQLAEEACKLEIKIMKKYAGEQDQYISCFGGLNAISYGKDNPIIKEICLPENFMTELNNRLMLL
jgi:D-glycero-alpha-D-manno-heptose-7-phosphate kinase